MKNLFEISLMIDFYGQLLTPRQYEIMNMYYNLDYSLAEISENLNITRQGVHDTIRKSNTLMQNFESKLGLFLRFNSQNKKIQEAINIIDEIEKVNITEDMLERLNRLKNLITTI